VQQPSLTTRYSKFYLRLGTAAQPNRIQRLHALLFNISVSNDVTNLQYNNDAASVVTYAQLTARHIKTTFTNHMAGQLISENVILIATA